LSATTSTRSRRRRSATPSARRGGLRRREIRYDRQQFRLRVQDDGKGFNDALLPRQAARATTACPGCANARRSWEAR
jgi:hypothetical protein